MEVFQWCLTHPNVTDFFPDFVDHLIEADENEGIEDEFDEMVSSTLDKWVEKGLREDLREALIGFAFDVDSPESWPSWCPCSKCQR